MRSLSLLFLVIALAFFYYGLPEREVAAASPEAEKIQAEIDDRNQNLKDLEAEIAGYEKTLRKVGAEKNTLIQTCLLYTSPSPRDRTRSRMPSSA